MIQAYHHPRARPPTTHEQGANQEVGIWSGIAQPMTGFWCSHLPIHEITHKEIQYKKFSWHYIINKFQNLLQLPENEKSTHSCRLDSFENIPVKMMQS